MNTEYTALDPQVLEEIGLGQPEQTATTNSMVVEETGTEPDNASTATPEVTEPTPGVEETPMGTTLTIDGIGEVKLDDVKEWQKGYLRQSDYTRKTQELAKQREDMAQAIEVYEYLKQNPHLVAKLKEVDTAGPVENSPVKNVTPENEMLRQLWYNQKSMELDRQVEELEKKYGANVDTVALFNKAAELKTDNLDMVYRAIAYEKATPVDRKALIEQAKEELRQELEQQKKATSSIISPSRASIVQTPVTLSEQERRVAAGLGMSEAEYAKWKSR